MRCIQMRIRFTKQLIFKIIALTSIFFLVGLTGQATDDNINRIVEGLQTRYGNMKGLAADFTQIYHDRSGRELREQGSLLLKRPGKMRWEYHRPEEKYFITDGK